MLIQIVEFYYFVLKNSDEQLNRMCNVILIALFINIHLC